MFPKALKNDNLIFDIEIFVPVMNFQVVLGAESLTAEQAEGHVLKHKVDVLEYCC